MHVWQDSTISLHLCCGGCACVLDQVESSVGSLLLPAHLVTLGWEQLYNSTSAKLHPSVAIFPVAWDAVPSLTSGSPSAAGRCTTAVLSLVLLADLLQ